MNTDNNTTVLKYQLVRTCENKL